MIKIPTMFERDETVRNRPATNRIKRECQWVLDGEGVATAKLDGTNVKIEHGMLLKRQKPKERDYDDAAYVPCDRSNTADRWAYEAFDDLMEKADGIYELVGPKIQGNPHGFPSHRLIRVVPMNPAYQIPLEARTFGGLLAVLRDSTFRFEGIVFHHPDGRLAKIKKRDYGVPWPPAPKESQS